jgi:hypothetical protein
MREPGTQEVEAGVKGAFEIAGADHPDTVEVSHAEFCRGLPAGHFRLIVNPDKARKFVRHRLFLIAITLPMAGLGAAAALSGYPWAGLCMVVAAVALNRLVTYQAPKILLHLATQDERTYREAIEFEILEVRRAR